MSFEKPSSPDSGNEKPLSERLEALSSKLDEAKARLAAGERLVDPASIKDVEKSVAELEFSGNEMSDAEIDEIIAAETDDENIGE